MALAPERLRSIIESLLLISPEPVPVARIVEVVLIEDPQTTDADVKAAIAELLEAYGDPERPVARGIRVDEVAGGLQLRTTAENAQFVRRFLAAKPARLTKASLETLSIIAYRQPCTKPEVETVRGVDAGAAIRSLLDRDLIRILGKRDEIGRPIIYGTTEYFLEFFGLKSLAELPTLREFHELDAEHQEQVDALDDGQPSIQELAAAASFLVDRDADPDLEALDEAVQTVDRVKESVDGIFRPPEAGDAEVDAATSTDGSTQSSADAEKK
jgi:segregation and condensation protein B